MSRRRRLVAFLCVIALLGSVLGGHGAADVCALVPFSTALPTPLDVVRRHPALHPSPPSVLLARDEGSRAPPLG